MHTLACLRELNNSKQMHARGVRTELMFLVFLTSLNREW